MPESKGRKKEPYTPPPTGKGQRKAARIGSPRWLAPTMVAMFCIGLVYIVVYYVAGSQADSSIPIMSSLSPLVNVAIGFAFIATGFLLSTRWR